MTSQVRATIVFNHPIIVESVNTGMEQSVKNPATLFKSDGEPGVGHDSKTYELNEWFSGPVEIRIREQP